jgi:hypothetical protein
MLSLLVFVVSVAAQSCAFVGSKGLCSETCNAGVFVLTSDGAAGCESAELAQPARICCVEAKCTAMQKEGFCGTSSLCKLTSVERAQSTGCSAMWPQGTVCCVEAPATAGVPTPAPTEFEPLKTWWVWLSAAALLAIVVLCICGLCLYAAYRRKREFDHVRRVAMARKQSSKKLLVHHPQRDGASRTGRDTTRASKLEVENAPAIDFVHAPAAMPVAPRDSRPLPPPPAPLAPPAITLPPPPRLARPTQASSIPYFEPMAHGPESDLELQFMTVQRNGAIDGGNGTQSYSALPNNDETLRARGEPVW